MIYLKRLQEEWRDVGMSDANIAKLIGMDQAALSRKIKNDDDIKASQLALICSEIERPMDMFVKRNR